MSSIQVFGSNFIIPTLETSSELLYQLADYLSSKSYENWRIYDSENVSPQNQFFYFRQNEIGMRNGNFYNSPKLKKIEYCNRTHLQF